MAINGRTFDDRIRGPLVILAGLNRSGFGAALSERFSCVVARIYRAKSSSPNRRMKRYYSPRIDWDLIPVLYQEAKRQGIPMTKLASDLIRHSLPRSPEATRVGSYKESPRPFRTRTRNG